MRRAATLTSILLMGVSLWGAAHAEPVQPGGVRVEFVLNSADARVSLKDATLSVRAAGTDEWLEVPETFNGNTMKIYLDPSATPRYEFRLRRETLFTTTTWQTEKPINVPTTGKEFSVTADAVRGKWKVLPLIISAAASLVLVLAGALPYVRKKRREALIAADKAKEAQAEADAADTRASNATSQAFALSKIPLPVDYRVGEYRIIDLLGEGGMASVYRVESAAGDRFAMKVPHSNCLKDAEFLARFQREIEIARSIQHPAVLRIYDAGTYTTPQYSQVPYLVMEIVKGKPLDEVIEEKSPLPIGQVARWARAIVDALGAAHAKQIIHRDVKPQNVMLTDKGEIKLMDFGIARASSSATLTRQSGAIGTPYYMAPEQIGDSRNVDERADIYAMGVVIYQMLTERLPFDEADVMALITKVIMEDPPPPRDFRPEIPEAFEALVLRMLAKSPDDRPHSAIEVASQLSAFVDL